MVETVELGTLLVLEVRQLLVQDQVRLAFRVQAEKEALVAALQALQVLLALQFQSPAPQLIMPVVVVVVAGLQLQLAVQLDLVVEVPVVDLVAILQELQEAQTQVAAVDLVLQLLAVLHLQAVPAAQE